MGIEFMPDRPIYQQLVDRIIGEIIRGALNPGDKLPSVREYALEAGVNANTMQRVYKELEHMGVTEAKRGQGSFVTTDETRLEEIRNELREQLVTSFMKSLESFGFTADEMIEALRKRGSADD